MNILFLYLSAFTTTGGLEKFNRALMKALSEIAIERYYQFKAVSAYDSKVDERYLAPIYFKGFSKNKLLFSLYSLVTAFNADVIILGHLNLAPLALGIQKLYPQKKIIVITHGIEVWGEISSIKKSVLMQAYKILTVSNYTKEKLITKHGLSESKIQVFHNTLDPYFPIPQELNKPSYLQERYELSADNKVVLTISRLSSEEQYKGYDKVIACFSAVLRQVPQVRYLLVGKYDALEKAHVDKLIALHQLEGKVIIPGFIPDNEIVDHYLLADVFVMPSKGEGFGIVFLEAMACGLSTIAGNQDGSVDALRNGELGKLVDPDDEIAIGNNIIDECNKPTNKTEQEKQQLSQKVVNYFGFDQYKLNLKTVFDAL